MPISMSRRSDPAGPSSSTPTGRPVSGPRPAGTVRPGRPAFEPGSVLRMKVTKISRLLELRTGQSRHLRDRRKDQRVDLVFREDPVVGGDQGGPPLVHRRLVDRLGIDRAAVRRRQLARQDEHLVGGLDVGALDPGHYLLDADVRRVPLEIRAQVDPRFVERDREADPRVAIDDLRRIDLDEFDPGLLQPRPRVGPDRFHVRAQATGERWSDPKAQSGEFRRVRLVGTCHHAVEQLDVGNGGGDEPGRVAS